MPEVNGKKYPYTAKGKAAAKKAAARKGAESPWDPDTEKLIKTAEMMKDLGTDPMGFMIKRPPKIAPNKGGATASRASTEARKRTSDKRTARREALKKLRGRLIPASPTN